MKPLRPTFLSRFLQISFLLIFVCVSVTGCSSIPLFQTKLKQTIPELPQAEVVFQVALLSPLPQNTSLALEIVDDITGLAMNPQYFSMVQKDDRSYFVKLPLVIGSVLKYRYIRSGEVSTAEYTPQGTQIRYRIASITGPAIFQDNISGWIDQQYSGPIGRVRGQFIDKNNNAPIPNLLVTAEGVQTTTSSDGSFILEGLTPGTHNLVAYSKDGLFQTFMQGVTIAEESTTPVFVYLEKQKLVTVTFNVETPVGLNFQMPLRFASNDELYGNSYTDLLAGSTMVAANIPQLSKVSDNRYQMQLSFPAGFDLHYKYSLGDGLWNSELTSSGSFSTREVVIPDHDISINDVITTFSTPSLAPISFVVNSSVATPSDENISIQFNPFGWFEPLPMTKVSDNQWMFTLYSPLNLFGQIEYRFCRNDDCDQTTGVATADQIFTPGNSPQTLTQTITQWTNYSINPDPTTVVTDGGNILPRPDFQAGFEFNQPYSPIWNAYLQTGLNKVTSTGSSTVVFDPTWTATRNSPPYLEPLAGSDYGWNDMQKAILSARQANLSVELFPQVNFPGAAAAYWQSAKRDEGWWTSWYDRYHRFIMQTADWAAMTGVNTIILGDPGVSPSMGNGILADGSSAGAPANADDQWRQLVQDVRSRFSGTVLGVVAYPNSGSLPAWLDSVDGFYVLYSAPLAQQNGASVHDLESIFTQDLENSLYPEISQFNKPVWLSINYPSSNNAFAGCTDALGSCLGDWGNGQIDLNTQAMIYNAAIIVSGKENWISGFIGRGNQPLASVQDSSTSVLAKPANDVLWFWYHFILNKTP